MTKTATRQVHVPLSQSAYIKFAKGSAVPSVTLDELKDQLLHYKEQLSLTGKQLGWDYAEAAFPYTIEQKPEGEGKWFYLKGTNDLYRYIVMGVGSALFEALDFAGGQIANANLSDYALPTFGDVPPLDHVLLEREDAEVHGLGETALPLVPAAVGNALRSLGLAQQHMPVHAERVLDAVDARAERSP